MGLMYWRSSADDNQYAHPLPWVPILDVESREVLAQSIHHHTVAESWKPCASLYTLTSGAMLMASMCIVPCMACMLHFAWRGNQVQELLSAGDSH